MTDEFTDRLRRCVVDAVNDDINETVRNGVNSVIASSVLRFLGLTTDYGGWTLTYDKPNPYVMRFVYGTGALGVRINAFVREVLVTSGFAKACAKRKIAEAFNPKSNSRYNYTHLEHLTDQIQSKQNSIIFAAVESLAEKTAQEDVDEILMLAHEAAKNKP